MNLQFRILSVIFVLFVFSCRTTEQLTISKRYNYDDIKPIKKKHIKKAKEVAELWLTEKSDSLNIPTLQLSELRYNPDEATMLLLDDYEEQENILSDEEKKERMKEIEKSGFYFIYSSYTNKETNKKHTIEFVYNLNKEISYVHIQEVENKDNFYFENLVNWRKNK